MDTRERLLAGGVVTEDTATGDIQSSELEARVYEHPALPGQKFVRFTPAAIGDATDVEMNVLGFAAPLSSETVGRTMMRALGFPAWAVVNDPKHARFALEVMEEFRKSARKIKSKPGFARDELIEIGKRLERSVPHFLPSFWEQAGREFIEEDSLTFAAQCFEKARAAEEAFKLKVDEDQRSRAYVEFALAGAVATKSLSGYAATLADAFGAKEGYARFLSLVVQRTRGGVPPWTGVAKDLRKCAKNARVAPAEGDERVVRELIEAPSMARAPADFWNEYRETLVRLAKADAGVRARVRWLFPRPSGFSKLIPTWLEILRDTGAVDAFVSGHGDAAGEAHGAAARWLGEFIGYARAGGWRGVEGAASQETFDVLAKVAPRVVAEGVPASLSTTPGRWATYDLDVLQRALELGIPLEGPSGPRRGRRSGQIDLNRAFTLDPTLVAEHPIFAPMLVEAVAGAFGQEEFESRAKGKKGFVAARRAWLEERIGQLEIAGVDWLRSEVTELETRTTSATFEEFPDLKKRLAAVSASSVLERTLRAGILDEFGWPDFEAIVAKYSTAKSPVNIRGSVSRPILQAGTRVFAFEGAKQTKEFSLPANAANAGTLLLVDGELLAIWWERSEGQRAAWSRDWTTVFEAPRSLTDAIEDVDVKGGGTCIGGRVLHAGDTTWAESAAVLSDGETVWRLSRKMWNEPITLEELDPQTGAKGRASWPKFAQKATEKTDDLRMDALWLRPVPPGGEASPLGVKDGLTGWYRRASSNRDVDRVEVERIDGVRYEGATKLEALFMFPHATTPTGVTSGYGTSAPVTFWAGSVPTYTQASSDGDDDDLDEDNSPVAGMRRVPPVRWMHYLTPRDEAGSKTLRTITHETCASLLAGATGEDDEERLKSAATAVSKLLPKVTHKHLREGVSRVVAVVANLAERLSQLADRKHKDAGFAINDGALKGALPVSLMTSWGNGDVVRAITEAAAHLSGGEGEVNDSKTRWHATLPSFGRALAFLGSREVYAESKTVLLGVARAYANTAFARGMQLRRAELLADEGAPILGGEEDTEDTGHHEEQGSRYYVRNVDTRGKQQVIEILEAFKGEPKLPKGTSIERTELVNTLDEQAQLLALIDAVEQRGPVPFAVADAEAYARLSGKSLAEAKLVVAGLPRIKQYEADFLGKELREKLDIKLGDAKLARVSLKTLSAEVVYATLGAAIEGLSVDDIYAVSTPEKAAPWVERLAASKPVDESVQHPPELLVDVKRIIRRGKQADHALSALVDPKSRALEFVDLPFDELDDDDTPSLSSPILDAAIEVWPWLALTRPSGDRYLEGLPAAVAKLRATLKEKTTFIPIAKMWLEDKQRDEAYARFGGKPMKREHQRGELHDGFDNGAGMLLHTGYALAVAVRPSALVSRDFEQQIASIEAILGEDDDDARELIATMRFFLSDAIERWMATISERRVPEGKYAADPRCSAAGTVKKAAKAFSIDDDAAAYYLQLLALPAPTDRFITEVNGWDTKALKAAKAALIEAKLVVEGKRERAGRDVFLPGAWEAKSSGWALPSEAWKLAFYAGPSKATIREAPGELFERALARASSDDRPRFEEVAEVRQKKGKSKGK